MVGRGERLVGRRRVAEIGFDRGVVLDLVPDRRRAGRHRVFRMRDARQHLVVDRDGFGGVERLRHGLGHHHDHRFADMPRLVGRQQRLRADENVGAARAGQLHVELGLGDRIVRDRTELVRAAVGAGEHAEHPRHRLGACGVDAPDAGMRMGRAHDRRIGLPRHAEIVAEAALTGDQAGILVAGQGFPDRPQRQFAGLSCSLRRVGHARSGLRGGVSTIAGCLIE